MAEGKKVGTSATRAKNKWNKNNYDSFLLTSIPKGRAEEWAGIAKELGYKSRNQMIIEAVEEKIKTEMGEGRDIAKFLRQKGKNA